VNREKREPQGFALLLCLRPVQPPLASRMVSDWRTRDRVHHDPL